MGQAFSELFEALRPDALRRLVEVRGTIDSALSAVPAEVIGGQFDAVLTGMATYLRDRDAAKFRGFISRWVAVRIGEGFASDNMVHSIVAVGDVVIQVAKQKHGPTPEVQAFARELVQLGFIAARQVVQILAEELQRRMSQRRERDTRSGR